MDFIERVFGISPDGGNGVLEALYFAALGAAILIIFRRRIARLVFGPKPDDKT